MPGQTKEARLQKEEKTLCAGCKIAILRKDNLFRKASNLLTHLSTCHVYNFALIDFILALLLFSGLTDKARQSLIGVGAGRKLQPS